MKLLPHYQNPFYLQENQGNNGFDYALRSESNPDPEIRIAGLKIGTPNDLQISRAIAFEVHEDNKIKSCNGLENFITLQTPQYSPIYIFDNHNHAFYFWHWERHTGRLTDGATLIHIDQHRDSRIPAEFLTPTDSHDMNKIFTYTNEILNVGNFIPPAIKTGLVKEMLLVDSQKSLNEFYQLHPNFQNPTPKNLILDIDIDFFAPELDYIGNTEKLALIENLIPQAAIITIATSPFFIDQNLAIDWIKRIFPNQ